MQENVASPKKPKNLWISRVLPVASVLLVAMVGMASAATLDINGTVGPILDSVAAVIPSIINLIIAIVPAVIVMSVIGFVVGFLDKILAMMKL